VVKNSIFVIAAFVLLVQIKVSAEITSSPHDFSGVSFVHGGGEICKVCHTPHNGRSTEAPLWRGRLGSYGTYTLYSSDTLDSNPSQPLTPSKACLTCHDGSIALGPLTGCIDCHKNSGHTPGNTVLSNDHPVSFQFDSALAQKDGALQDPAATPVLSLGGKTIQQGMLYQDRLECPSCHDVHATKGDSATAPHLLLVDNIQDKLCLTCHRK